MHLEEERGKCASKSSSTELLESADNHLYDECGAYNDMSEHLCVLHHNPHCHYHQSIQNQNRCDNKDAQLNPAIEYTMSSKFQELSTDPESTVKLTSKDFIYEQDAIASLNTGKSLEEGIIKNQNTIPSNTNEAMYKESCAHCHCPIKSTFVRQIMDIAENLERKESNNLNLESPMQAMLTLNSQSNCGAKLSSGDTGKKYI